MRKQNQSITQDDARRMRRASLLKMAAIAVFIIVVLVFGSVAWFTMNREVEGTGVQMTAAGLDFELQVEGNNLGADVYAVSGADTTIKSGTSVGSAFQTDGSHEKIQWNLGSSNGGALRPGSSGTLSFEVIPKKSGTLEITFSFNIEGFTAAQTKTAEDTYNVTSMNKVTTSSDQKQQDAVQYLNGRILFFLGENNVGLLNPDGFTLSEIKRGPVTATKDQAIPVTIYWVWPNTYSQMILNSTDNPNGTAPISADTGTLTALRSYVIQHRSQLFTSTLSDGTVLTDEHIAGKIGVKNNDVWQFDLSTAKNTTNLSDISYLYNSADQMIGLNLQYALLTMSAE